MSIAEKYEQYKGCFDVDLCIENLLYAGIYAKKMQLPAGYFAVSHKHEYDHMSILAEGKCLLVTDNGQETYTAPAMIKIPAGLHHEIVALEDILWFCIHASDHPIDDVQIEGVT